MWPPYSDVRKQESLATLCTVKFAILTSVKSYKRRLQKNPCRENAETNDKTLGILLEEGCL